MDDNLIQFHAVEKDWAPEPIPATKALPDWYRNLAGKVQVPGTRGTVHTAKQCLPLLDAMTSGYVLPLSGDVHFTLDESGQLTWECPNGDIHIERHNSAQVLGSPWADLPVIKFANPWVIVTPPGYSVLFVPPLNHEPIPFRVLSGLVDTDTFYEQVNFPSVCMMARGTSCVLKRGTPLAQVIPIKREPWRSQIGHADAQKLREMRHSMMHNHHVYRELYHHKKAFDKP
jgi:hypothetical protein